MNLKKAAVIVALCVILLAGGCLKPKPSNPPSATPDQNLPQTDQNTPYVTDGNADANNSAPPGTPGSEPQIIDINMEKYPGVDETVVRSIETCNAGPPLDAEICLITAASSNKSTFPCTLVSEELQSRCLLEAGKSMADYKVCDTIKDFRLKDDCYNYIGKSIKDSKICKYIEDGEKKDDCYNGIGTFDTCKSIFEPKVRDQCYKGIASTANDADICLKVSDTYRVAGVIMRDDCLKQLNLAENGEKCDHYVDNSLAAECFGNANNVPDTNFSCTTVADQNAQDYCNSWYNTRIGDVDGCYTLKYDLMKSCVSYIADNLYGDTTCPLIRDLRIRNNCFYAYASDFNSMDRCLNIDGNTDLKDSCILNTAQNIKSEDDCLKISKINLSMMESCITNVAFETKDARKCEKIQRDAAYLKCYVDIAVESSVPEVCDKIPRQEMKSMNYSGAEQCYNSYAVAMKDDTYCLPISHDLFVKECKENVKVALTCVDGDSKCDPRVCTYDLDPDSWHNTDSDCTQEIVDKYVKQGIVPFDLE